MSLPNIVRLFIVTPCTVVGLPDLKKEHVVPLLFTLGWHRNWPSTYSHVSIPMPSTFVVPFSFTDDKLSVEIRDVPNVTSSSPSSTGEVPEMTSFSASSTQPSQRTRMMLTPWQSEALKRQFALHPYPDTATKAALALRLGLDSQWISVSCMIIICWR